jgi:hypothetical protein
LGAEPRVEREENYAHEKEKIYGRRQQELFLAPVETTARHRSGAFRQ